MRWRHMSLGRVADRAFKVFVIAFYALLASAAIWYFMQPDGETAIIQAAKAEQLDESARTQLPSRPAEEPDSDALAPQLADAITVYRQSLVQLQAVGKRLEAVQSPNVGRSLLDAPPRSSCEELLREIDQLTLAYRNQWSSHTTDSQTKANLFALTHALTRGHPIEPNELKRFCANALKSAAFLEAFYGILEQANREAKGNSRATRALAPFLRPDLNAINGNGAITAKRFGGTTIYDTNYLMGARFEDLRREDQLRVKAYFDVWPVGESERVFKRTIPSPDRIEDCDLPKRLRQKLQPLLSLLPTD